MDLFTIIVLCGIVFLIATARAKAGFRKGLSDSIETTSFITLKANKYIRDELSDDFDTEFTKLLEPTPPTRNLTPKGGKS